MAFKVGDEVQSKHELKGRGWGGDRVAKGKKGTVVKVSIWSDRLEVDFNGTMCEVTDEDVQRPGWFS